MEKNFLKEQKKYVIKEGEVLTGSALLKKKNKKAIDRVNYMIDNMDHNKAFLHSKNTNNIKSDTLLENFKERYKKYRMDWNNQPMNSIKNKFSSSKLKSKNVPPLRLDIETAAICDLACPFCFREFTVTIPKDGEQSIIIKSYFFFIFFKIFFILYSLSSISTISISAPTKSMWEGTISRNFIFVFSIAFFIVVLFIMHS